MPPPKVHWTLISPPLGKISKWKPAHTPQTPMAPTGQLSWPMPWNWTAYTPTAPLFVPSLLTCPWRTHCSSSLTTTTWRTPLHLDYKVLVRFTHAFFHPSPSVPGLVPRLSFSEGRREPGNIGGFKPWTSAAKILAEPIRLQNEKREHVTIL